MITLKELMEIQKLKGEYESTDIQIIQEFFELNNLEEDAIDLISQLTKSKINKIKKKWQKLGFVFYHQNIYMNIMI